METQMVIRIAPEAKERFSRLARMEGKTASEMVRELMEKYIKERDIGNYIDNLWSRIGRKLRSKGVKRKNISRAIKEARNSKGRQLGSERR